MANLWQASKTLAAADDDGIAESQSPGAGAITLDGILVTDGVAVLDTPRRIIVTSGADDTDITFTIVGTNQAGNPLSETITGANNNVVATTQDFATVTSVTHTGSVQTTVTVGTNGEGSTPWFIANRENSNALFGIAVVKVPASGTIDFDIEFTLDDPNAPFTGTFPTTFDVSTTGTDTEYVSISTPVTAIRATVNSGTDEIRVIIVQEGEGHI